MLIISALIAWQHIAVERQDHTLLFVKASSRTAERSWSAEASPGEKEHIKTREEKSGSMFRAIKKRKKTRAMVPHVQAPVGTIFLYNNLHHQFQQHGIRFSVMQLTEGQACRY